MIWYRDLYIGRLIGSRSEKIIYRIDSGDYPAGVWLVTVPADERRSLEVMACRELRYEYTRNAVLMILGLAQGREEAMLLVETIVQDAVDETGSADIRAWLSAPRPPRSPEAAAAGHDKGTSERPSNSGNAAAAGHDKGTSERPSNSGNTAAAGHDEGTSERSSNSGNAAAAGRYERAAERHARGGEEAL